MILRNNHMAAKAFTEEPSKWNDYVGCTNWRELTVKYVVIRPTDWLIFNMMETEEVRVYLSHSRAGPSLQVKAVQFKLCVMAQHFHKLYCGKVYMLQFAAIWLVSHLSAIIR